MTAFLLPLIIILSTLVSGGESLESAELNYLPSPQETEVKNVIVEKSLPVTFLISEDPSEKYEEKNEYGYPQGSNQVESSPAIDEETTMQEEATEQSTNDTVDNGSNSSPSEAPAAIPSNSPTPESSKPKGDLSVEKPGCGCGSSGDKGAESPCVCIH